jgi:uncharacterized membrane protein YecN with MAPEG domain
MAAHPALFAVAFYAGLNGLILLWLAVEVSRLRLRGGIWLGDGGDARLARAMRGQANFVETVPFCLLLLLVIAGFGAPLAVVHGLGAVLTVGRLLHGWHFVRPGAPAWMRSAGAGATFAVLLLASLSAIGDGIWGMMVR